MLWIYRAIVAYEDLASARAAADADHQHLRVRLRKPKHTHATESHALDASMLLAAAVVSERRATLAIETEQQQQASYDVTDADHNDTSMPSPLKIVTIKRVQSAQEEVQDVPASNDEVVATTRFMVALERPPSEALVEKMPESEQAHSPSDSIQLEDVESPPATPTTAPQLPRSNEDDVALNAPALLLSPRLNRDNDSDDDDIVAAAAIADHRSPAALAPTVGNSTAVLLSHEALVRSQSVSLRRESEHLVGPLHRGSSQLRIAVRSHGTVDRTQTQERLQPQTLRSTEDLQQSVGAERSAVHASPRGSFESTSGTKKPGFLTDLKQILKRKKTPPLSEFANAAARLTSDGGAAPASLSPTRPRSLPLVTVSKEVIRSAAPLHHALEPDHQQRQRQRQTTSSETQTTVACRAAATQTYSPARVALVDQATETITHSEPSASAPALMLQSIEAQLKRMQTVRVTDGSHS